MEGKELRNEFNKVHSDYSLLSKKIESVMSDFLDAENLVVHSISCRCKTLDSLELKAQKKHEKNTPYLSLDEITDLSGVRIITHFSSDLDKIADLVEREFDIDFLNSVDKREYQDPEKFGYASIHYVVSFNSARLALPEYSKFAGLKAEIQIRSILQHAWAEIEHDIGYKADVEIPRDIRRRFSRLSGLLELADQEFEAIRTELDEYAKVVRESPDFKLSSIAIDKTSLHSFVFSNEYVGSLDEDICKILQAKLCEPSFDAGEIQALEFLGFKTLGDILAGLHNYRELILQRAHDVNDIHGISSGLVCGGVSIAYLMQVFAAESDDENTINGFLRLLELDHDSSFFDYLLGFNK
ncbi:hypothetical protein AO067_20875 [Pseudomonas viridiflava ICMP 13104]|uniref:RelA/SpoT domain-containing protein n=1 Tax=Pseudomonas viridiflava ICMP 13104 TaxID=1198305 RepID=A0A0W0H2L1_PSEVI|nr:hypothetical protein AO067_20875 [Pseudomonas viridiflava ICMP 13104]